MSGVENQNSSGRAVIGTVIALGISVFLALLGIAPVLGGVAAAHVPAGGGIYVMVAAVLGVAFVVASIAWLITWFAYGRVRTPEWGYAYFLMSFVFVALIYGAVASTFNQFITTRSTENATADAEINKAMKAAMDTNGGTIDMRIHAKGEAGEMEGVVKSLMADLVIKRNAYLAQMQALGIKTLMKPSNLAKDKGLKHTQATLAEARAALRVFRGTVESLSANFSKRVEASHMTEYDKQSMIRGFNNSLSQQQDERETIFACEDNELAEFQKMAALLAHPKGRWIAKGDKILFSNSGDLAAYQTSVEAVRADVAQQQEAIAIARNNGAVSAARGYYATPHPGYTPPQRITY